MKYLFHYHISLPQIKDTRKKETIQKKDDTFFTAIESTIKNIHA